MSTLDSAVIRRHAHNSADCISSARLNARVALERIQELKVDLPDEVLRNVQFVIRKLDETTREIKALQRYLESRS